MLSKSKAPLMIAAATAATFAAAVPTLHAAAVNLVTSDALGATSFNAGTNWSNATAPSPANDYTVGANLTLRTPSGQASNITFAGNSLSLIDTVNNNALLILKNNTGTTTTINNLTLDGGQVQNGGNASAAATIDILAGNAITLGATAGGTFTASTSGRTLTVNNVITGGGQLTLNAGNGLVLLNAANTYTGNTTVSGTIIASGAIQGAVRANDGTNLTTAGNLALNSGVLQTAVNITRNGGTAAGRINLSGAAAGFSAVGANVTVAIGGLASPGTLVWGSAPFSQSILVLNDSAATGNLTFANPIDLGFATRTVFNSGGAGTSATLSGGITSETASAGMSFYGGGTTVLNTTNAFTGAVIIGSSSNSATSATSGVLRATASAALGTGVVTIGNGGGSTSGRLELSGGISLPNAVVMNTRNASTAGVQNLAGNNTLNNLLALNSGGTYAVVQSDAGLLTLTGNFASGNNAISSSASGARTATLAGAGNGLVSGVIANGSGTISVAKTGAGTWTLSNAGNSYTGSTTLAGGVLSVNAVAAGGVNSNIGASTNAAANLAFAGGALEYTGGATSTDRLFTVGAAGGTINSGGSGAIGFTNAGTNVSAIPVTNGTWSNGTNTITATAGSILGMVVGQTVTGTGIPAGTTVTGVNYNANTFTISANATASGNGATLTVGNTPVRVLTLAGSNAGNNTINSVLANASASALLGVTKTGTGTWTLGGTNTYTGVTTVAGGTLKATVNGATQNLLANAGGVNLTSTSAKLILDYTGGTSPVSSVMSLLNAEYAAGTFGTIGQIRSTTLTAGQTIGYADAASAVTIRVTLPGDADLNGAVDFNDFLALQNNFGVTNATFGQGNFNYDGVTDFNDFLALQNNFGQSVTDSPVAITAAQVAAIQAFASEVPEPTLLASMGLAIGLLKRRRQA